MTTRWAAVACAVALMQGAVMAQRVWQRNPVAGMPSRYAGATVYDSARARVVLFGGLTSVTAPITYSAETWEWDGISAWQLRTPAPGPIPAARSNHAMAYDSLRGRVVLFGGTLGGGSYLGDTWEWDGTTWTQRASGPTPRIGHAMAFDSARGRTVMFGGLPTAGSTTPLSDTWEWNGTTWSAPLVIGPGWRTGAAMAFDSARGRTVLFGGVYNWGFGTTIYNDTWEWDGAAWTPRVVAGPAGRWAHVMAYDIVRGKTVLAAGQFSTLGFGVYGDTWEWDGTNWTAAPAFGPGSPFLFLAGNGMTYDSLRGNAVITDGGNLTWEWVDPDPGTATSFGSGCGNPPLALSADGAAPPSIGSTARALVTNSPAGLALVALGLSRTSAGPFLLPVPLDGYGMIGCFLLQSSEAMNEPTTATGPGTAAYSFALPLRVSLMGVHLYLQSWALAPGMNPANIITSNGLDWFIGY